jgi:membrane-bound lytic murein transglycosylase B
MRTIGMQARHGLGAVGGAAGRRPTAAFGQANAATPARSSLARQLQEGSGGPEYSPAAIAPPPLLVLDQRIINIDRGQRFFAQNFLEISDKMLAGGRLPNGAAAMKKHQALFAREEKDSACRVGDHRLLGLETISAPARQTSRSSRWRRSPTTAAARRCSAGIC